MWSRAGNGLTSLLLFVVSNCEFVPFLVGILGTVWCLIVSIPDLCNLTDFVNDKVIVFQAMSFNLILFGYDNWYNDDNNVLFWAVHIYIHAS